VGTDLVEVDHPTIALALLRAARGCGPQLELAQVAVHSLVAAVVLRATRT
jgi:hypothetical protein